jgi:WD40 repeat protein
MLVAGLSNGNIDVIKYSPNDNKWTQNVLQGHKSSVNAVKFCPYVPNKNAKDDMPIMRFVSCSCDNNVYEWVLSDTWISTPIGTHEEWVRDVSWASNNMGMTFDRIVSGGEDKKVKVWKKAGVDAEWQLESEIDKQAPVWRVEFNLMSNLLSVCSGDNLTSIYKEKVPGSGDWQQDSALNEDGLAQE